MNLKSLKASVGKLFSPVETKSADVLSGNWFPEAFLAPNTIAGPAVTSQSARKVTAVEAAVSLISSNLGSFPAKLYQRDGDAKRLASGHPAHRLIHRLANAWTSAGELRRLLTQDALLTGNGFAIANRPHGEVVEFLRVPPNAMSIKTDHFGAPSYILTTTGGPRTYSYRDVLHLRALATGPDGVTGLSPISLCREAIALALVMEEHAGKLFKDGARPSMAVSYPAEAAKPAMGTDGAAARRKLVEATRLGMAGTDNAGKLAILFDGATATPFAFSSTDAQFLELRRFAIDEIARAFRVPPTMLFELGRGTWGNTEQMGEQFVAYTLRPWLDAWSDAYARVLFDPDGDDDLTIEFVTDDLLRADTATRFESYSKAIAARILNPNEVRAMENRAPYEGGDEFLNPNTTTGAPVPAKEAA